MADKIIIVIHRPISLDRIAVESESNTIDSPIPIVAII